jgi:hypothetical protein
MLYNYSNIFYIVNCQNVKVRLYKYGDSNVLTVLRQWSRDFPKRWTLYGGGHSRTLFRVQLYCFIDCEFLPHRMSDNWSWSRRFPFMSAGWLHIGTFPNLSSISWRIVTFPGQAIFKFCMRWKYNNHFILQSHTKGLPEISLQCT